MADKRVDNNIVLLEVQSKEDPNVWNRIRAVRFAPGAQRNERVVGGVVYCEAGAIIEARQQMQRWVDCKQFGTRPLRVMKPVRIGKHEWVMERAL